MIKRYSIILFLCFTIKLVFSQVYFSKNYPIVNHQGSIAFNTIENDDGYFMVGGGTDMVGRQKILIIQTDFEGNVLFEKLHGDTSYHYYVGTKGSLQKVSTGGYVMYGSKNDGSGSNDLLYRFTEEGDTLWTKQLADSTRYIGRQVKETPDGGFICIGDRYTDISMQVYLIKTDSLGNKEWEQNYGGPEWDIPSSISVCNDGGYIYTGTSRNSGSMPMNDQIRIMKVDSLGNVVFNRFFGEEFDSDGGLAVIQTQDGGYAISGSYVTTDRAHPFILKLDQNGDSLWINKVIPFASTSNTSNNNLRSILELNDGSLVAAGYNNHWSPPITRYQGLVVKLTATGDLVWQREHHIAETNTESSYIYDIRRTSDNEFICSGVSSQPQEMWLLKLDSLGCADTACALATAVEETKEISFGDFKVYPNPAHSFITVELQHPISVVNFKLIDLTGKQVLTQKLSTSYTQINVQELPKGIYFYELISEKERYSGKLVVN